MSTRKAVCILLGKGRKAVCILLGKGTPADLRHTHTHTHTRFDNMSHAHNRAHALTNHFEVLDLLLEHRACELLILPSNCVT